MRLYRSLNGMGFFKEKRKIEFSDRTTIQENKKKPLLSSLLIVV
jgi:hypothetical protein